MLSGCLAAGHPAAPTHPAPRTSPSSTAGSATAASGDTSGGASGGASAQAAARPASGEPLNAAMSHCSRLPDLPTPPADALDVTRFGARPDDELPDDEGITRALAALKPGGWLLFPPGRYLQARSIRVTVPHATLWGPGATLHALDTADQTLGLRADGVRLYHLRLTAATDHRRTELDTARITIAPGGEWRPTERPVVGNVVRGVRIEPDPARGLPHAAASAGIFVTGARSFTVADNHVEGTLADGIHITGGSREGRILRNRIRASGDDLIATVSYYGPEGMALLRRGQEPRPDPQVSDVLIEANDGAGNAWGRGIGIIGSRRITVRGNRIQGVQHAAGIIVAQEAVYHTPGPVDVLVEDNQISDIQWPPTPPGAPRRPGQPAPTGHAGIEVHAYANPPADVANPYVAERLAVRHILLRRNRIERVGADGIRIGAGTPPQLIADIDLLDNRISQPRGRPLAAHTPQALRHTCGAEDRPSAACQELAHRSAGARLDCARLP